MLPTRGLLLCLSTAVFIPSRVLGQFSNQNLSNTTQAFETAKIVPDVLSSFNPAALLGVEFMDPSTNQAVNVTPGILLSMEQTMQEPQFFLTANVTIPSTIPYVLVIVDPDAPMPQNNTESQFRHMLGRDFHIDNSSKLVNTSAALSDFVNPTPPAGSDPHRYVVLAFIQPADFNSTAPELVNASTPRNNFNLTTFGEAVNLGSPIAGTYFLTGPSSNSTTSNSTASSTSPASSTSSAATSSGVGRSLKAHGVNLKVTWGVILCSTIYGLVF
ncbi:phosphatidylethanolamine-binding protein [Lentinula aciculospora]|uniref:Phosphatidylethanolamine-binding protein n=1 Tax=Lentinula aciculospora TaxID=153920 RepID=A0A9W9AC97_9AGAR|nr:phosphatidylethanolamine-binding protein [Lentinula aciculospora]